MAKEKEKETKIVRLPPAPPRPKDIIIERFLPNQADIPPPLHT